ncbi:DNA-dependent protein kinase catalytic subunit-like [Pollicipes pollicipes]|uniref:DNA-dependent protein kinase catalytic subunit-like n=1 Tax=Pollicipes pollicipes TaxID=41117 RepID=UPI001884B648|nr:DNA-dependent protein kinase catalytic subunit-like [Pollicipes pollicipes]
MLAEALNNEVDEHRQEALLAPAQETLDKLARDDRVRWVICLAGLSPHCRPLALSQRSRLVYALPGLYGEQKATGLQVLLDVIDDTEDVFGVLHKRIELEKLAESRDTAVQFWSLKILVRVEPRLSAQEWCVFLPSLRSAVSVRDSKSRKVAAELCIALRQRFRSDSSEPGRAVVEFVTDALLELLTDPDPVIRQTAANHWSDGVDLEDTTPGRLGLVLTGMFRPGLEAAYLSYSTYLVLGLAARSPDYSRKMFDRALPECQFKEQPMETSWRLQSAAAVPLFSLTQTASGSVAPALLLQATQRTPAFAPTQLAGPGEATFDWLTQASLGSSADSGSLVASRRGRAGAGRLTYTDDKADDRAGGGDAADERMARMLRHRVEVDARRVSVELLRRYRHGELPDTEIPYSDLLRPLQALAMAEARGDLQDAQRSYKAAVRGGGDELCQQSYFQVRPTVGRRGRGGEALFTSDQGWWSPAVGHAVL